MNTNGLIKFKIVHSRLSPKKYKFTHNYFWFKIDLDNIKDFSSKLFSYNKFGLYSFYDKDHLRIGEKTARANYIKFAKESGLQKEIINVTIFTQLRFVGYVFNPVSFILLKDSEGEEHAIIEIGNTFNELKPYFVSNTYFNKNGFNYKTKKLFYISPFLKHDNEMHFRLVKKETKISIFIDDYCQKEKMLQVSFDGYEMPFTTRNLLNLTIKNPFITLQFIVFIHLHAFNLWMKGIKYLKKDEDTELQKGTHVWKT